MGGPANSKVWSNYEGLRLLLLSTHSNCSGSRGNKHTQPKRLVLIEGADRQGWGMVGGSSPVCMLAHLAHLPGTSRLALLVSRRAAPGGRAEMLTATHGSP